VSDPRVLTQSELSTWLRCRRKWWLGYYRKLRRKRYEGAPLSIGNLVHYGLEAWYRPSDRRHPSDAIRAKCEEMLGQYPDSTNDILDCAELAGIMVEGYMEWLEAEGPDSDLEVVGAETPVEVQIGAYRLRGKIDAPVVRRSDSLRLQLEHKTAQNLTDIPKTAQTNFQFLTYDLLAYLAARQLEPGIHRTDGIIVNMLRKVKRTARAKPPFYGRHEVRHNTDELRNHWRHVLAIARETDAAAARLDAGEPHQHVVPPTPMRNCSFDCSFYAVCGAGMFDDGSDVEGMLASAYELHDPLERYAEGTEEE